MLCSSERFMYCAFGCGFFFFKQKTAYEVRISDWSSDVCSSDLPDAAAAAKDAPTDWPHVDSAIAADPAIEARVREIVAGMTLAQKVGQMTQAEIKSVTPEQVREYYIGSVLNGEIGRASSRERVCPYG